MDDSYARWGGDNEPNTALGAFLRQRVEGCLRGAERGAMPPNLGLVGGHLPHQPAGLRDQLGRGR
jgi:hypothetical protein